MSPDRARREKEPEELVWEGTVIKQQLGQPLTAQEERALELRAASLSIAEATSLILEDPTLKENPVMEAEVTAQYWQGLFKLDELGVTAGIHVGAAPELFKNPVTLAEYVGGQWIGVQNKDIPSFRQAMRQTEEIREQQIAIGEGEVSFVQGKYITPQLKDWMVMRSFVNVTRRFLAYDIDRPRNHKSK